MNRKPIRDRLLEMTLRPVGTQWGPAGGTVVAALLRPLINGRPLKYVTLRTHIDRVHHDFTRNRAQKLIRNYDCCGHLRLLITYFYVNLQKHIRKKYGVNFFTLFILFDIQLSTVKRHTVT